jgi:carboxymethylenebutenolidase
MPLRSSTVDVPTTDGSADATLVIPEGDAPLPGILMWMDAFGLRPRLTEMAERIASQGYVVLVPNAFYRHGRAPVVELGDLSDPEARSALIAKLGPMLGGLTPEPAMRDADGYLDFLTGLPEVAESPVGVVGYCFGGALALRTAAHRPELVAAAAAFHPARLATDAADSPHLLADRIRAEVYVGSADQDPGMPVEQQRLLDEALTAAGVRHVCEQYDGAPHGFTMSDTAAYDEAATDRHWDSLLGLFARALP